MVSAVITTATTTSGRHRHRPADDSSWLTAVPPTLKTGLHVDFSSFGPTADRRPKPTWPPLYRAHHAWCGLRALPDAGHCLFSSPLVAGAAARLWQQHRELTAMQPGLRAPGKVSGAVSASIMPTAMAGQCYAPFADVFEGCPAPRADLDFVRMTASSPAGHSPKRPAARRATATGGAGEVAATIAGVTAVGTKAAEQVLTSATKPGDLLPAPLAVLLRAQPPRLSLLNPD
jgi:hypothetical protein